MDIGVYKLLCYGMPTGIIAVISRIRPGLGGRRVYSFLRSYIYVDVSGMYTYRIVKCHCIWVICIITHIITFYTSHSLTPEVLQLGPFENIRCVSECRVVITRRINHTRSLYNFSGNWPTKTYLYGRLANFKRQATSNRSLIIYN